VGGQARCSRPSSLHRQPISSDGIASFTYEPTIAGTHSPSNLRNKTFRWDHVSKLKGDQLAAKAEHAILSTHKFPEGTRQLHIHEGIVVANPARVVSVAIMIRQHLVQAHTLRLSGVERESKTAALYEFITSEQCTQLLARVDERANELLDEQLKEKKWHEKHWQKEGEALRAIQRAKADIENKISSMMATGAGPILASLLIEAGSNIARFRLK
jgi:hypothetical protein